MAFSMAPAWFSPKANRPAAIEAFRGVPVDVVRRATCVLGGVSPWSQKDTSMASSILDWSLGGNSPISSRKIISENEIFPISSSSG